MFSLSSLISFVIYLVIGAGVVIALLSVFRKLGRQEQAASPSAQWEKAVEDYGDEAIAKLYQNATTDQERAEIAAFVNGEMAKDNEPPQEAPAEAAENADDDAMGVTTVIPDFQRIALEDMALEDQPAKVEAEAPALEETAAFAAPAFAAAAAAAEEAAEEEEAEATEEAIEEAAEEATEEISEETGDITEAAEEIAEEAEETAAEEAVDENDPAQTGNVDVNKLMSAPAYNFWQEEAINNDENEDKSELCARCGCKLAPGAAFCVICGAKIGDAPEEAEEAKPAEEEFSFFSAPVAPKDETPAEELTEDAIAEEAEEEPKKFFGLFGRKKDEVPAEEALAEEAAAEEASAEEAPEEAQEVCPICGAPVQPDCTFCIICGTNLAQAAEEPAPAAAPEAFAEAAPAAEAEKKPADEPAPAEEEEEEDVISLDDILANVKALEARIFAEAEEADKAVKQQTLNE